MKLLHYPLILLCLLFSSYAVAVENPIQPQTQGDVSFVSGGIGKSESDALKAIKRDYNLNLLFAAKGTGDFLADVNVRILDAQDQAIVEALANGPYLFAKLKPGNYTVTAEKDGKLFSQKVRIASGHTSSLSFYWPQGQ